MLLTKTNTFLIGPIATLLGIVMNAIFLFCGLFGIQNIGLCIILFTIVIYGLMIPLTIRQQKFSKLQSTMQPEIQMIQAKYKDKKDQASMMKMNEETKAVYDKYGVSMFGSCLPMLIQLPILFALYRVIWNVPAYVASVKDVMMELVNALLNYDGAQEILTTYATSNSINFTKLGFNANSIVDVLYKLKPADWSKLMGDIPSMSDLIQSTQTTLDKMNYFLGMNISDSPMNIMTSAYQSGSWLLLIGAVMIPLLSGATQWLNTKLMPQQEQSGTDEQSSMANSLKTMNTVMPIMSMVFCLTLPAGLGIYWIASAVVRSIVQVITNKRMDSIDVDEMVAKNLEKINKKRAKQGLPPQTLQKVKYVAPEPVKEKSGKKQLTAEEKQKKIQEATEYYKNNEAKPGSIASKARMVEKYNEKNEKNKRK